LARARNTITRTNPTSIFDPEYQSFAGISVKQPLLRGFGPRANRAQLRVAQLELGVSFFEKEIMISNQLVELINAFHDILYAQENLRVKNDALRLAQTLLEDNRRRVE
ncbi:TolC family protein, partial [Arthrospira platensis SPKY1]|nr:TolC family protein [Arthrospira platensis SPKY1]